MLDNFPFYALFFAIVLAYIVFQFVTVAFGSLPF